MKYTVNVDVGVLVGSVRRPLGAGVDLAENAFVELAAPHGASVSVQDAVKRGWLVPQQLPPVPFVKKGEE